MKPEHDLDALGVDLNLEQVDLLVVGNDCVAEIPITIEEAFTGVFDTAGDEARHHEDIFSQVIEGGLETTQDVAGGFF